MKNLKIIIRLLVGVVFITSAVLKLLSVDHFELYIYSFGIFNFFITSFLSRLLITFEFLLGIFLIFKTLYQKTWWISMLTMIGFTLFLVYVAIFRNDTNCHCFGSFVELDPTGSIFKNIAIILMLLFVKNQKEWHFRFKKWIIGIIIGIAIIGSFVIVPPDALYNKIYLPKSKVHHQALQIILQDSSMVEVSKMEGDHIVAFFVSGCKFCKMSMQKMDQIFMRNNISKDKIKIIILGDQTKIDLFKKETKTEAYMFYPFNYPKILFTAVYGSFPTIIYMHGNNVEKVVNYRGIDEKEMVDFLTREKR